MVLAPRGYPTDTIHPEACGSCQGQAAQIWGSPDVHESYVGFLNMGVDLAENLHAYAYGGYGTRPAEGGFYFRSPATQSARGGVFRFGSGENAVRAVADLDLNDDVDCAGHPELPSLASDRAAVDAFINMTRGDCFLFNEPFPGGFTPRFGADITDFSVFAGLRGGSSGGFNWDASFGLGHSQADYFIYNTVNASLGPNSPTSFKPRSYVQDEWTASLQMGYPIDVGIFSSPLNVAFGVEYRSEAFETKPGDSRSYEPGPFTEQGFSVGSNGYQGLNPAFADRWYRPNYAAFVDLETDVNDAWVLGLAVRHENYIKDFGSVFTGKLATLYRITDRISFRGTASTGFRAPTPGQNNLWALQTALSSDGDKLVESGQLPSTHPVAAALGGKPLTEETSTSISLGTVVELSNDLTLTFDYFNIHIADRLSLTGNIAISPEIARIMNERDLLEGVRNLSEVKYFSNDFDTRTQGVDLLLAFDRQHSNRRATTGTLAWNWTKHRLLDFSQPQQIQTFLRQSLSAPFEVTVLTPRRQIEIETLNPSHRLVASVRHLIGNFWGALRVNYWGSWEACILNSNSCEAEVLHGFPNAVLFDAEVGVILFDDYRFAIGADNLFNHYVNAVEAETLGQGNARPTTTPYDYNGTHVYVRFTADLF